MRSCSLTLSLTHHQSLTPPSRPCSYAIKKKDEIERVAKANR